MNTTTYYVVERDYAGPNADQHLNAHTYTIRTAPARGNMSHEPIIDGWAGTTDDWAVYGRGQYETREAAEAAIAAICGDAGYRESEDDLDECVGEVVRYLHGRLEQWGAEASQTWAYETRRDVTLRTTDDEIERMADGLMDLAEAEASAALDRDAVVRLLTQRRQELRDQALDEISETVGYTIEQVYLGWRIRLDDEAEDEHGGWLAHYPHHEAAALALIEYVTRRRPELLA
ncbi:MAG TPA: hypothetical protein VF216_03095 [Mizugakiibacter sp.]